jgi:hypothetical protein
MTEETIMAETLKVDTFGFDATDVRQVHKYRLQVLENIGKVNRFLGKCPSHIGLTKRYYKLKEQLRLLDLAYQNCRGEEIVYRSYL